MDSFCPHCGAAGIRDESRFCTSCGEPIRDPVPNPAPSGAVVPHTAPDPSFAVDARIGSVHGPAPQASAITALRLLRESLRPAAESMGPAIGLWLIGSFITAQVVGGAVMSLFGGRLPYWLQLGDNATLSAAFFPAVASLLAGLGYSISAGATLGASDGTQVFGLANGSGSATASFLPVVVLLAMTLCAFLGQRRIVRRSPLEPVAAVRRALIHAALGSIGVFVTAFILSSLFFSQASTGLISFLYDGSLPSAGVRASISGGPNVLRLPVLFLFLAVGTLSGEGHDAVVTALRLGRHPRLGALWPVAVGFTGMLGVLLIASIPAGLILVVANPALRDPTVLLAGLLALPNALVAALGLTTGFGFEPFARTVTNGALSGVAISHPVFLIDIVGHAGGMYVLLGPLSLLALIGGGFVAGVLLRRRSGSAGPAAISLISVAIVAAGYVATLLTMPGLTAGGSIARAAASQAGNVTFGINVAFGPWNLLALLLVGAGAVLGQNYGARVLTSAQSNTRAAVLEGLSGGRATAVAAADRFRRDGIRGLSAAVVMRWRSFSLRRRAWAVIAVFGLVALGTAYGVTSSPDYRLDHGIQALAARHQSADLPLSAAVATEMGIGAAPADVSFTVSDFKVLPPTASSGPASIDVWPATWTLTAKRGSAVVAKAAEGASFMRASDGTGFDLVGQVTNGIDLASLLDLPSLATKDPVALSVFVDAANAANKELGTTATLDTADEELQPPETREAQDDWLASEPEATIYGQYGQATVYSYTAAGHNPIPLIHVTVQAPTPTVTKYGTLTEADLINSAATALSDFRAAQGAKSLANGMMVLVNADGLRLSGMLKADFATNIDVASLHVTGTSNDGYCVEGSYSHADADLAFYYYGQETVSICPAVPRAYHGPWIIDYTGQPLMTFGPVTKSFSGSDGSTSTSGDLTVEAVLRNGQLWFKTSDLNLSYGTFRISPIINGTIGEREYSTTFQIPVADAVSSLALEIGVGGTYPDVTLHDTTFMFPAEP